MIARYAGKCALRQVAYEAGTEIVKTDFGWVIVAPSHANIEIWTESDIREGQTLRHHKEDPDSQIVTAVHVHAGSSFDDDFDDEESYFCTAFCRVATEEEAARFLDEEAKKQAATKRDADFRRLFNRKDGEYIQGQIAKRAGEQIKVGEGFGVYGVGQELFVEAAGDWVWVVSQNGMDGDDWSASNWGGAIALRYALTPERLALVKSMPGGEAIGKTPDQKQTEATARLLNDVFGISPLRSLFDTPIKDEDPDPAYWVQFDGNIFGVTPERNKIYLKITPKRGLIIPPSVSSKRHSTSSVCLLYAPTIERLSLIEPLIPSWAGTSVLGRFALPGQRDWADNAADILRVADNICAPLNQIEFALGVRLIHMVPAASFDNETIMIWDDQTLTRGTLYSFAVIDEKAGEQARLRGEEYTPYQKNTRGFPACTKKPSVAAISHAASSLLTIAASSGNWRSSGKWNMMVTVQEITSTHVLDKSSTSGQGWFECKTLERLDVRHLDGREHALYKLSIEWASMGEDADAGTHGELFENESEAKAAMYK